jgi:crotonobetainyl-CoA:carnitine CoA-transferase CaiB-like acyl-CoA transferase
VLVVDLSESIAGAFATRLLAQRGEEAVAIGTLPGWAGSYLRSGVGTVDRSELDDVVRRADVVLTGWEAGRPSHEIDIAATNPAVVEVVVGTFGADGPYARLRGGPLVEWAAGGYLAITGLPGREPLAGPANLPAYVAGYVAASAAEVGLRLRDRGHPSPRIDVSTMEVMASAHQTTLSDYAATGEIRRRHRHPQPIHPLGLVRCADGWVSVAAVTDAQFDAFAVAVGHPELIVDGRFANGRSRCVHAEELDAVVWDWFIARNSDEVVHLLQAAHVPAVEMTSPATVLDDPQLAHRGYWELWGEGGEAGRAPGDPIHVRETACPPVPRTGGELALSGTLVVDLTDFWAGPMATRMLADLGATVVRVERPGSRCHAHPAGPFVDWKMHRGKQSLAVDLRAAAGREVVRDLAHRGDVLVENFRPGVMARFGLAYGDVAACNPGIVYLSLSGFGQDGPHAPWASFGPLLEAASSMQARTAYDDGVPLQLGHSLPDPVGGFAGLFAVLNRLRARAATGLGAYLDVSQLEAYAAVCGEDILQASVEGGWSPPPRSGRLLRCRGEDSWVAIEGEDSWVAIEGSDDQLETLAEEAAGADKFEVAAAARALGLRAFAVLDAADLANDPHMVERGFIVEVELAGKRGRMPSLPMYPRERLARTGQRSPVAGEHTVEILQEVLGYPRARIDALLAAGAVVQC